MSASACARTDRLHGIAFAKQYPNPAEPLRGLFVAQQVAATAADVEWTVLAPVPWAPRWLAAALSKPYVKGDEVRGGIEVLHPRYPVLPRRLWYGTVGASVAWAARAAWERVVSEHHPQFVHVHALYPSGAAARRLASAAALPYVVSIHGSDLYTNLADGRARREITDAAHGAACIICVSRSLADAATRELGIDPGRVVVIPDTYDDVRFSYIERPAHDGPVRLVSVGRLVPVKGFDLAIEAVSRLRAAGTDVVLEIVGDGPLRSALESLSSSLGVSDAVSFAGALPPEGIAASLGRADLYMLASRSEGFGVALVEALATGMPAVATDCGGPSDIVDEGDGVLVAVGDAGALADGVSTVIGRRSSFVSRSIAARAHDRFGAQSVAARLLDVYRSIALR